MICHVVYTTLTEWHSLLSLSVCGLTVGMFIMCTKTKKHLSFSSGHSDDSWVYCLFSGRKILWELLVVYVQSVAADGKESVAVCWQDISVSLLPASDWLQVHQTSNGRSVQHSACLGRRAAEYSRHIGSQHPPASHWPTVVKPAQASWLCNTLLYLRCAVCRWWLSHCRWYCDKMS